MRSMKSIQFPCSLKNSEQDRIRIVYDITDSKIRATSYRATGFL
jgi:hypothetical protein